MIILIINADAQSFSGLRVFYVSACYSTCRNSKSRRIYSSCYEGGQEKMEKS